MACCAVFGCNNNKKKNKELKFYGFPKEEEIAKQWVMACHRQDTINIKSARVCADHFEKSDFHESLRHRLLGYLPRNCRNLKPDAMPTLKIPYKKDTGPGNKKSVRPERKTRRNMDKEILDKSSEGIIHENEKFTILTATDDVLNNHPEIIANVINANVITVQFQQEDDVLDPNISVVKITEQSEPKHLVSSANSGTEGCQCQSLVTAANILAAKYMVKVQNENEELKAEITNLNNQLQLLKAERKNFIVKRLKPIFTDGQIRCLFQPVRKRICWSDEDITSAITLRSVSPSAYRYLREKMNYPLPAVSTLRKWVRMKIEREPTQQILELVRAKMPSLTAMED